MLWLIPALPLAGYLLLASGRFQGLQASLIGVGSVALAFVVTVAITLAVGGFTAGPYYLVQSLWTWIEVGTFSAGVGFYLDGLSLTLCWVITGVGSLIHLYSTFYMHGDAAYSRYFAYLNLFVASMLVLVLADNLLLLYLGWEGVGLCSYLLIGFWYQKPENGYAARKAFVVTRVGDLLLALGLFLIATRLGTLDIQALLQLAPAHWGSGDQQWLATVAGLLLLGGAVGKSAQLPLQTWLPDAMAGPTPVSALIHAATMVTAGVYLIARMNGIYLVSPVALSIVGVVGALTLLVAGTAALVQSDIKRILAYSTVSQIGYMFLALGVGAWSAAIFHLVTHAFFKALLFLAAGTVIHSLHDEQNIYRMGGLRKTMPVAFLSFLAGGASLAALPLITAGFYSKDAILIGAWNGGALGIVLWFAAMLGALITALYIFRLIFIVFFGEMHTRGHEHGGINMWLPLLVLAILALVGGAVQLPLEAVFPPQAAAHHDWIPVVSGLVSVFGVILAWYLFLRHPARALAITDQYLSLARFWKGGWGFDTFYRRVFVTPFMTLAHRNRNDIIDSFYRSVVQATRWSHAMLSATQTGQLRWYAMAMGIGAIMVLAGVRLL